MNINVGILGHVDSGKTALAKALSKVASTAAFDKNPQSQARGITLDLGFSACEVTPENEGCAVLLKEANVDSVQCTFVDCPGHASLIRTVVGGAQIIDVMVLVIDATKGVQPQTAECLVLGEVMSKPLIVVINKVDAVQGSTAEEKAAAIARLRRKLQATFSKTRWPGVPMVEVAAAPRGTPDADKDSTPINTSAVLPAVLAVANLSAMKAAHLTTQESSKDFYMLVDHCFAVKGQGTVFTGTVAAGCVHVGESVLIPDQHLVRKVKGLQVFRKPVDAARRGDRVGLCVAQFDPTLMERGVLCSGGNGGDGAACNEGAHQLTTSDQLIAEVHRVRYHPLPCDGKTKFHITIGHSTVMGSMRFFCRPSTDEAFSPAVESSYVDELDEEATLSYDPAPGSAPGVPLPATKPEKTYFAVLLLEKPVLVTLGSKMIALRLDVERENFCRIAVAGTIVHSLPGSGDMPDKMAAWRALPVVRYRDRPLRVDRVLDARSCIADGVVSLNLERGAGSADRQKSDLHGEAQKFVGLHVQFVPSAATGEDKKSGEIVGQIASTFGKTGKVKLQFTHPVFSEGKVGSSKAKKGSDKEGCGASGEGSTDHYQEGVFAVPGSIVMRLKKYPFAFHSSIQQ